MAQVRKNVYLIGGWDSTTKHENDTEGKFHDEIKVFDLETLSIETILTKLRLKRSAFSLVVDERASKIYLQVSTPWGKISGGIEKFKLQQSSF